jgi:hypothetical protein
VLNRPGKPRLATLRTLGKVRNSRSNNLCIMRKLTRT